MFHPLNTGTSARVVDLIKNSTGMDIHDLYEKSGYQGTYNAFGKIVYQLSHRSVIHKSGKLWMIGPKPDSGKKAKVVPPRTYEWKAYIHRLSAPFQRPAYDAPGCVIRSRMNTNEVEVLA